MYIDIWKIDIYHKYISSATIDYCVAKMHKLVILFKVHEWISNLSDDHCMISVKIKYK